MSERDSLEQYKKELNAMLIKGFEAYKPFCRKWDIEYSNNPEVALRAFHKARTAKPGLPLKIRQESKRILDERHSSSFDDGGDLS